MDELIPQSRALLYHRGLTQSLAGTVHSATPAAATLRDALAQPNCKEAVRSIPPQELYHAIQQIGLSDCTEALELISQEQFTRLCDYDVWQKDDLAPQKVFTWLKALAEVSPEYLVKRFQGLDEEYQLATLRPYLRVFDNAMKERMSDADQDQLQPFPGHKMWYFVETGDPLIAEGIDTLLESFFAHDMQYALSLAAHASYAVPNENEELLRQFRNARLEEDGFVTYEEGCQLFIPTKVDLERVVDICKKSSSAVENEKISFLWKAVDSVNKQHAKLGLMYLANALCQVSDIEPSDTKSLQRILLHVEGLVSAGLEYASGGCIHKANELLEGGVVAVFKQGLGCFYSLQERFFSHPDTRSWFAQEHAAWQKRSYGSILDGLDRKSERFGMVNVETLKGIFNRFPLVTHKVDENRFAQVPVSHLAQVESLTTWIDNFHSICSCFQTGKENDKTSYH